MSDPAGLAQVESPGGQPPEPPGYLGKDEEGRGGTDPVRVQSAPFDAGAELNAFCAGQAGAGAVVSFTGVVRDPGGLIRMEIEHYPGMTEAAIAEMVQRARIRFGLTGALVIHRFGSLAAGEAIMMVATAAPHRVAAFQAAEFLMDYLKSRAPFWKKEVTATGEAWVAATCADEEALGRW